MNKFIYCLAFMVVALMLFITVDAYCHWHFDVINPVELYQIDKEKYEKEHPGELGYMTYYEWQIDQDGKDRALWNEITHQICESFDPWYERTPADEVREHGQD